jgi:ubiquinol-cytochrome c reductase cytochrome b subunit
MFMLSRIRNWIEDRWPLSALIHLGFEEEIPGGASYAYVFGSATLIIFILQIVTGICQLRYYVPTLDHAYDSLNYLRTEVPFGWLIHSLHYWGASAMVFLVGLHMCRVFIWGAYKKPRELTWLVGLGLLLITLGIDYTGPTLSWDERGYWVAEVGTSIAGTIPVVGDVAKRLMLGGETMGQLTLSNFFILHTAVLPGILIALISIHLVAFRRFGAVGPWDEKKRKTSGPFWPDQIFNDAVIATILAFVLIDLSIYIRAPITGPADPLDTSYIPKAEWNFLFLYEGLKFFPGKLEPIGTIGISAFIILLLISVPFLDRRPENNPRMRLRMMMGGLIFVLSVLSLAVAGHFSKGTGTVGAVGPQAPSTPVASVAHMSASARQGAKLFQSLGCIGCHRVHGVGGTVGPALSSEVLQDKSREWLIIQIRNSKAHFPNSIMPPFSYLSLQQTNALVDYLLSLAYGSVSPPTGATGAKAGIPAPAPPPPTASAVTPPSRPAAPPLVRQPLGPPGPAAAIIGSADHGAVLFKADCESCHGPQGTDKVPNPGSDAGTVPPLNPISPNLLNVDPETFADNIDRYIQHGSTPKGQNPGLQMLPFGDSNTLTQQAISEIEAYVMQLNGVDRAQLAHPGVPPRLFFLLAVVVFGLIGLALTGIWIRIRKSPGSI